MKKPEYNREKLKALIHYVIWKAGAHAGFGATKLNKIAWFSDAQSFLITGKPITGAEYIREKHGPILKDGVALRKELVAEGAIEQWEDREYDYRSWRFKAKRPPDTSLFSPVELTFIKSWIKTIDEDHTASSASELSHDYGWEIAKIGEPLPLYARLADRVRSPKGKAKEWVAEQLKRLNLAS